MRSALRIARQVAGRRHASTTSAAAQTASKAATETAGKAKDQAAQAAELATKARAQAANYASKGVQALSKAGDGFAKLAAKTGGRTGRLLKSVEAAIPPTIYYTKVFVELSKIVFRGQKMTPPDLATFQSTLKPLVNPSYLLNLAKSAVTTIRTAGRKEIAFAGVLGAEVIGFFTVGEIIGKRKLVGYRGEPSHGKH